MDRSDPVLPVFVQSLETFREEKLSDFQPDVDATSSVTGTLEWRIDRLMADFVPCLVIQQSHRQYGYPRLN